MCDLYFIAMLSKKQSTGPGIASLDKESQNNTPACNIKGNLTSITTGVTSTTIKEEPADILGLVNMKKEDNFSPSMSPVGFGSLGSIGVTERSVTPGRSNIYLFFFTINKENCYCYGSS